MSVPVEDVEGQKWHSEIMLTPSRHIQQKYFIMCILLTSDTQLVAVPPKAPGSF